MTLVRIVALTISDEVVRWASPGCKEWAEGLEREAAVIESDWAALRWSIGSMRVLLDRRPAPFTSLGEVPAETQKLVETTRWRAGFVLAMSIMQGFFYSLRFFHFMNSLQRIGCALVVLGSVLAGTYSLMERRRLKEPWKDDIYDDLMACISFYKEQLKRFDSLWIYLSFFLCWVLGESMYDGAYGDVFEVVCSWILVGMLLYMLLVMHQRKRNNLRRIKEIDSLLAEREHGTEL
jgi:hypothetical protein